MLTSADAARNTRTAEPVPDTGEREGKHMKKAIKLNAQGRAIEVTEIPDGFDTHDLAKLIGCSWIEIVRPRRLEEGQVLVIDEEGRLKPNTVNLVASYLYEADKHGEPIVGNALVMKEVLGNDGPELAGLEDYEVVNAEAICDRIMEMMA